MGSCLAPGASAVVFPRDLERVSACACQIRENTMAGVALACVLGPVAYSLGSPTAASARRGAPAMQYSLNNYPLPGPLSPVYNQALVKLSRSDETTTGGLFLAAEEKEKATTEDEAAEQAKAAAEEKALAEKLKAAEEAVAAKTPEVAGWSAERTVDTPNR